ncbi:hypothetical protein C0J52_20748 [Blattella germanica]|nr:hypothetical protein C0J52_20748 [Blattella germanica]
MRRHGNRGLPRYLPLATVPCFVTGEVTAAPSPFTPLRSGDRSSVGFLYRRQQWRHQARITTSVDGPTVASAGNQARLLTPPRTTGADRHIGPTPPPTPYFCSALLRAPEKIGISEKWMTNNISVRHYGKNGYGNRCEDETDGNHEQDMAAAAVSRGIWTGYFLYLHPPKAGFWGWSLSKILSQRFVAVIVYIVLDVEILLICGIGRQFMYSSALDCPGVRCKHQLRWLQSKSYERVALLSCDKQKQAGDILTNVSILDCASFTFGKQQKL